MKRFVFEFTNEENDRAIEEFYLLKNVETAKSDCKTLCCVFAMMPLLLVFLYIIDSVREEDLKVILGLCVVVIIVGAATIFRLMYFGGAVPLGEIYNKEVRPSEEFQKSKKQLIFEGDVCRFVAGLEIGTMKCEKFSKVLESMDPSENYRGTALEGLDAFQRQLKRFDIHVKGAGSDMVEKFFHTTDSAVLFPEFVSRVVRQGMESDILPEITATTTNFDGMDYRTIASVPTDDDKALRRVEEGAVLPTTAIRTQENLVKLHKRGRMLVASYEAIRFQRLDLFSVTLRQIGAYIARMHLDDAVQVLMNGDGNNNAADAYEIGSGSGKISGTAGTLTYSALLEFWSKFDPYSMNTMLVSNDVMLQMLKLSEFQNPLTGLNFQGTGTLSTPLGAKLLRTSAVPAGKLIGLDKNYALEHICGSEVMVEYDKLIDRQIERAAITSISGFAKPYQEASKVLTV